MVELFIILFQELSIMRCKKQDSRAMAAVVALLVMIFVHSPPEARAASITE
jgi:hypothetical protein